MLAKSQSHFRQKISAKQTNFCTDSMSFVDLSPDGFMERHFDFPICHNITLIHLGVEVYSSVN